VSKKKLGSKNSTTLGEGEKKEKYRQSRKFLQKGGGDVEKIISEEGGGSRRGGASPGEVYIKEGKLGL